MASAVTPTSRSAVKVITFAGAGRSGSTLLARLLGELDGFVNIGEATAYWLDDQVRQRQIPCGCGRAVAECPFWRDVLWGHAVEPGSGSSHLLRLRSVPLLLSPVKPAPARRRLDDLTAAARSLLCTVAERHRGRVIVDSSKNPALSYLLRRAPDIELHVLHLVRDPRAFVSSRFSSKAYLGRLPPFKATWVWLARNLATELLLAGGPRHRRIRYEDLVADPGGTVSMIATEVLGEPIRVRYANGNETSIGVQHILAGNPDKLEVGPLRIADRGWSLPWHVRALVSGLTLPLRARYGYWSGPPAPSNAATGQ